MPRVGMSLQRTTAGVVRIGRSGAVLAALALLAGGSGCQPDAVGRGTAPASTGAGEATTDARFDALFADAYVARVRDAAADAAHAMAPAPGGQQVARPGGRVDVAADAEDALRVFQREMRALQLDPADPVDVMTLHHALLWGVANQDRVAQTDLPLIRAAIGGEVAARAAGGETAQERRIADQAAVRAALHTRRFARLVELGDASAAREHSDLVAAEFRQRYGIDLRAGPLTTTMNRGRARD